MQPKQEFAGQPQASAVALWAQKDFVWPLPATPEEVESAPSGKTAE